MSSLFNVSNESLTVSIVSLRISNACPLKPDELKKLNEPNELYDLHPSAPVFVPECYRKRKGAPQGLPPFVVAVSL
jgi:hypothetical protein